MAHMLRLYDDDDEEDEDDNAWQPGSPVLLRLTAG